MKSHRRLWIPHAAIVLIVIVAAAALLGCSGDSRDTGAAPAAASSMPQGAAVSPSTTDPPPASTDSGSPSATPDEIVVYALGDAALEETVGESLNLAEQIPLPEEGLDLFVYLGDVYPSGTSDDFRVYDRIWGGQGRDLRARTASIVGNHESDERKVGWVPYWSGETSARWPGSMTVTRPPYYTIKLQGWKLIALDTTDDLDMGSDQYEFLEKELKEPGYHTIVFGHHPRWSSGEHGDDDAVDDAWRAMVEDGAVAYVSGHEHNSQIHPPRDAEGTPVHTGGCVQIVAGAGGAAFYPFESGRGQSKPDWGDDSHYAVLRMTLRADAMEIAFVDQEGAALESRIMSLPPIDMVQ
jgi:hypothetical protein